MAEDKPHLHVTFYTEPVEDVAASRKEGRPIFRDTEMVKILIAGDPKNTIIAQAQSGHPMTYAERFPEHYRMFKAGLADAVVGTPLSEVPWLTASRREELKALNVRTVEALAELEGSALQRAGMGARDLKNKAVAWLESASGHSGEGRMASELAARDEVIEQLRRDIEAMKAGKQTAASVEPEPIEDEPTSGSPFAGWQDEDIKNWIKDNTGSRPPGNPSHATLVARADAVNAELAQKAAA